jgi:hypothetical protein
VPDTWYWKCGSPSQTAWLGILANARMLSRYDRTVPTTIARVSFELNDRPRGDLQARQPLDVPLKRTRQGFDEVVQVEHQVPLR